jgi:hypothetical protein
MRENQPPETHGDHLADYIYPLMPDRLFAELRANLHQAVAQGYLGGVVLTKAQGQAIEDWLSDQLDIIELVEGFDLAELERFVMGIELEDLFLKTADQ